MSDRYAGTIDFPKWAFDIPMVMKQVVAEFGDSEEKWKYFYDYEDHNGIVHFLNDQAADGHFEDLEFVLADNKVPYDQWSAGYAEFDSETVKYRPEIGSVSFNGNNGEFVIYASQIQAILDKPNLKNELKKLLPPDIRSLNDYTDPPKELGGKQKNVNKSR